MAKTTPKAFYLGTATDKARRIAALTMLAKDHGLSGASAFLQAIADGKFILWRSPTTEPPRKDKTND